ncbi:uncharacterized protein [Miscanthus floridulus]|uniref:uncharacterized protein n=1 Tax=Miscanthus floridulus TaxID=154761 RepID=UPI003457AC45
MDLAMTPARRPMDPGLARCLWHVVLAVCHMLWRGLSPKRIMMDIHLLLGRGKLVRRTLRDHLAHNPSSHHRRHGHHLTNYGGASSSSSTLASFYGHPREVEFSCTTMPSYPQGLFFPFKGRGGGGRARGEQYGSLDKAVVARAFEMLSAKVDAGGGTPAVAPSPTVATATPSPMVAWILGRSLAGVRPLRVTDSAFPAVPKDGCCYDDFIRKFYKQLRL